jgi:hypothetical protein
VLRVCVFLSFCPRIRIYLFWDFWQALTKILQETFFCWQNMERVVFFCLSVWRFLIPIGKL